MYVFKENVRRFSENKPLIHVVDKQKAINALRLTDGSEAYLAIALERSKGRRTRVGVYRKTIASG